MRHNQSFFKEASTRAVDSALSDAHAGSFDVRDQSALGFTPAPNMESLKLIRSLNPMDLTVDVDSLQRSRSGVKQ